MPSLKLRIAVIGLALVAGAALLEPTGSVLGWLRGEPFLAGRSLSYWAAHIGGTPAENAAALEAIGSVPSAEAEPLLVALYGHRSDPAGAELRWTAIELLAKRPPTGAAGQAVLIAALDDSDEHVRSVAMAALPKSGVTADRGVPLLVSRCSGDHAVVAARALSEYRAAAAPALPNLIALLQNEQASVEARWNAARTIGKIGPDALSAVPALIADLDHSEDTIREHAAEAIGDIGPVAAELGVPALRGVLQDPYVKVRRDAVRSLGYIGPAASAAVEEILPLLQDPEAIVRTAARDALQKIAPDRVPPAEPASAAAAPSQP